MTPIGVSKRFLAALFMLHFMAFMVVLKTGGIYMKDSFEYLNQAYNLFHYGSWYAAPWNGITYLDYFSFRPPLYAVYIGLIKMVTDWDYAILIVQNFLSIWNMLLVYRIAQHEDWLEEKRELALIVLLCMMPLQLMLANRVMSEILFQTLLLLLFYSCYQYSKKHSRKYVWSIGGWLSLLLLTKPVAMFLLPVVMVWMVYVTGIKPLSKWLSLAIVPLTFALIGIQHQHESGLFHYSSMKPFNQYKFHARFILANKFGEGYAESWADSTKMELNRMENYNHRYHKMQDLGDSVMLKYPFTFLKLYIKGCAVFMLDPGRHDLSVFMQDEKPNQPGLFYSSNSASGMNEKMNAIPAYQKFWMAVYFLCNLIVVIGLFSFIKNYNANKGYKLILIWVVIYLVLATGMLGVARYRSALFPELMLACLFAMDHFLKRRNRAL